MQKPIAYRGRAAVKEGLHHWMRTLLAGLLTILIADYAVAFESTPSNANRILCLHPNASLDRPGRKAADAMMLDCLLWASSTEKTASWQRELRRCLSDHGVILAADCQY
jgi:hypothetical protein